MIVTIADLVDYLKHFHRHWMADPTIDAALIPGDLPDGLALLYREIGALCELDDYPGPFAAQDVLRSIHELERIDGMIEFALENQGDWTCRCPPGPGDPPVYGNAADTWSDEEQGYVVVCDSLDHFLTTLGLQEAVMSCRHQLALLGDPPPETLEGFGFRPLWLDGQYVLDEPAHDFYELPCEDVLLMKHRHEGLFLGSPSVADLDERLAGAGLRTSRSSG